MTSPRTDQPTLLEVSGLCVDLERGRSSTRLVSDVSFSIARGGTLGIVGETGSGKSLTAAAVMGVLPARLKVGAGSIRYDGQELVGLAERQHRSLRGNEIAMVFQDAHAALNPALTIGDQIGEVIRVHTGMSRRAARISAVDLLDRVGIRRAGERVDDYPHQMSGGMAQRAMIAIAIACNPHLLIADEPTTALDATVQAQILQLIRRLQREMGMSLLIISHDLSVIAEMVDDVAVMYAGQFSEYGPARSTLVKPTHPYTEALLGAQPGAAPKGTTLRTIPGVVVNPAAPPSGCRFHPRCVHRRDACAAEVPALELVGETGSASRCLFRGQLTLHGLDDIVAQQPPKAISDVAADRAVLVSIGGLTKTYRTRGQGVFGRGTYFNAVDNVSLQLFVGETLGVVGESGAGKSTVGRVLLGLTDATSGVVHFDGVPLRWGTRQARRFRRDVQVVFQNPFASLDPTMTIGDTVAEPLAVNRVGNATQRRTRVDELLDQVGLASTVRTRYPQELSGGQRQRVAIARALALQPKLIVCDEPLSALDVSTQAQIINLLRDLQREHGTTYLFIGHDLPVVHQLSDRIAVMRGGEVVEIGPADDVYYRPQHDYTRALLSSVLSVDPRQRTLTLDTGMDG
ncbi:MAG TPA: ABC transporter ATP-binding protein [Ilumatobacteraceae bacterium]|nr:ABC transporter ATP-binding protein [Ilumatobacteraceae bacterium]